MLQGMTAHYLAHSTFPLAERHRALGARRRRRRRPPPHPARQSAGATVYATVGSDEKAELARSAGADEAIVYTRTDFVEEVRRLTGGAGVDVVYDSVGQATFEGSLKCLRPRGYLVLFGQSSGPVPPVDLQILSRWRLPLRHPAHP